MHDAGSPGRRPGRAWSGSCGGHVNHHPRHGADTPRQHKRAAGSPCRAGNGRAAGSDVAPMALQLSARRHGGVPTLFMNGRPTHGMTWFGRPNSAADFARAGLHICTFQLSATEAWWIGENKYDFQSIDRLIDEFVRIDPKIMLMPRIHLGYQDMAWWAQQNP